MRTKDDTDTTADRPTDNRIDPVRQYIDLQFVAPIKAFYTFQLRTCVIDVNYQPGLRARGRADLNRELRRKPMGAMLLHDCWLSFP